MNIYVKLDGHKIKTIGMFEGEGLVSIAIEDDKLDYYLDNLDWLVYQNGIISIDESRKTQIITGIAKSHRLEELKKLLADTDYKVVKCYEASMLGEPLPYDLPVIVSERRAWREELNLLEQN